MELNSHFVSRFLTRPWEFADRRLFYYDFDTDRFGTASSRSLFAEPGLNSTSVEGRLNALIESPISRELDGLLAHTSGAVNIEVPWPLLRAVALLLVLQPARVSGLHQDAGTLEQVLARDDHYIDELSRLLTTEYRLRRVTVGLRSPLLYPSAGFFPLVGLARGGGCEMALAIPLSPWHVVIAEPASVEWEFGPEAWRENEAGFVANASVGTAACRKVVVHPTARSLPEPELRENIQAMRQLVTESLERCAAAKRLMAQIERLVGL